MRRFLLLALLACNWPQAIFAEPTTLVFESFNNESGLSQNTVNAITQDSRGYLWIATQGGLHRYDGYRMQVLANTGPNRLPDTFLNALIEDHDQRLWIGSSTSGLSVFDLRSGQLQALPSSNLKLIGDERQIHALAVDKSALWIGSDAGIRRVEWGSWQTKTWPSSAIQVLQADGQGGVYAGSLGAGLVHIGADGALKAVGERVFGRQIRALYLDRFEQLWVGSERGLGRLDLSTDSAHPIAVTGTAIEVPIWGIVADIEDNLWLALHGAGVGFWRREDGVLRLYEHQATDPRSLPDNNVRTLFRDRDNVLWVGTNLRGLASVALDSRRFALFREYGSREFGDGQSASRNDGRADADMLARNNTRALHFSPDGTLWVGTDGAAMKSLSPGSQQFRSHYPPLLAASGGPARSYLRTLAIVDADPDHLFVGGDGGVLRYNMRTERATKVPAPAGATAIVARTLLRRRDGELLVGTVADGVYGLHWPAPVSRHYRKQSSNSTATPSLSHNNVLALHERPNGDLWVGTIGGLNRIRAGAPSLQFFQDDRHLADAPSAAALAGNIVRSITTTKDGSLWIGSHGGLSRVLDPDGQRPGFENFGYEQGLSDTTIYGVLEDEQGFLWVSTNSGLARFDVHKKRFQLFDRSYGLQGSEFNGGAYARGPDGRLFFGGVNGFNGFYPASLQLSQQAPPLYLSSVQIGDQNRQELLADSALPLRFDFDARVFRIEVAAIDLAAPGRVQYSWRLQGFDKDWSSPGARREFTYTNLDPGKYVLSVRASNHDGVWSERTLDLPLEVVAPFWLTRSAKLAYFLCIVLVAGLFIWNRVRRDRERDRVEKEIRESAQRLQWSLWGSGDGLWVSEVQSGHVFRDGVGNMLGYDNSEVSPDDSWRERLTHPDDVGVMAAAYSRHLMGETSHFEATYRLRHRDGHWVWMLDRGKIVERDAHGEPLRVAGTMKDVTERRRYEDELRYLANYDTLSGLPNRTLFNDRLRHALAHARRQHQRVGLLFFDLDRFKQVNDTLGHGAGDQLLKQVAQRVGLSVRNDDTVSRLGGDEFTVILEDLPSASAAGLFAEKLLTAFKAPFRLNDIDVNITPSIGISIFPDDGDDASTLLKHADLAMYHAKELGRNTYQYFVGAMNEQMHRRHALESSLRLALANNEFSLHYQPKMSLASGRITGCEALLRWHSAELGKVSPVEFIPLAEETGLIIPIGDWVIAEALRQLKQWQDNGLSLVPIAVNLSLRQLMSVDVHLRVDELLQQSGVAAQWLQMEITESLIMDNAQEAIERLNRLRERGILLAVDDFGTGYSSLNYLRRLPIDIVKIDKSFIRDIGVDEGDATITRTIIAMAHALKLTVVAEGVETEEQLAFLRSEGCEEMQGFIFAKPMPAASCEELLRKLVR